MTGIESLLHIPVIDVGGFCLVRAISDIASTGWKLVFVCASEQNVIPTLLCPLNPLLNPGAIVHLRVRNVEIAVPPSNIEVQADVVHLENAVEPGKSLRTQAGKATNPVSVFGSSSIEPM